MGAYRIINSEGKVILIDPYLNENPASPIKVEDLEHVDLICVTHLAFDHLGDTVEIAHKFNCPVCCGAEVKYWLTNEGLPAGSVLGMCWGLQVMAAGVRVRGVISMHTSARVTPQGEFISGPVLGFIIYPDPGVRIYHSADTAISSELKVIGEVYRPNIALMGLSTPPQDFMTEHGLQYVYMNEMTGNEAALAAQWVGAEYALASHYFQAAGNPDVEKFVSILSNLHSDDLPAIKPIVLEPGEVFTYPPDQS
jgi:L-ascorbate metabolism protein UlaG (beta-lactamase superfamily)